jgi:hypothetical protein
MMRSPFVNVPTEAVEKKARWKDDAGSGARNEIGQYGDIRT